MSDWQVVNNNPQNTQQPSPSGGDWQVVSPNESQSQGPSLQGFMGNLGKEAASTVLDTGKNILQDQSQPGQGGINAAIKELLLKPIGGLANWGMNIGKSIASDPTHIPQNAGKAIYNNPIQSLSPLLLLLGGKGGEGDIPSENTPPSASSGIPEGSYIDKSGAAQPIKSLSDLNIDVNSPGEQMNNAITNGGYQQIMKLLKQTGTPENISSKITEPVANDTSAPVLGDIGKSIQRLLDTSQKDPNGIHSADINVEKNFATDMSKNFKMGTPEQKAWGNYSGTLQQFLKDNVEGYQEASDAYKNQVNADPGMVKSFSSSPIGKIAMSLGGPGMLYYFFHRWLFNTLFNSGSGENPNTGGGLGGGSGYGGGLGK